MVEKDRILERKDEQLTEKDALLVEKDNQLEQQRYQKDAQVDTQLARQQQVTGQQNIYCIQVNHTCSLDSRPH